MTSSPPLSSPLEYLNVFIYLFQFVPLSLFLTTKTCLLQGLKEVVIPRQLVKRELHKLMKSKA